MSDTCSPKKAGKPSMILFHRQSVIDLSYFHRQSVINLSNVWFCRGPKLFYAD